MKSFSINKFITRKRILVPAVILPVLIALIVVFSVSSREKTVDYSYAHTYYKENVVANAPQTVPVELTEADFLNQKDVIGSVISGYVKGNSVRLNANDNNFKSVTADFIIPEQGNYHMFFDYKISGGGADGLTLSMRLDNTVLPAEFNSIPVEMLWRNESNEFGKDRINNDVLPMQVPAGGFFETAAKDFEYKTEQALAVPLKEGHNIITLTLNTGEIYLGNVTFKPIKIAASYSDYYSAISGFPVSGNNGKSVIIEAETPLYKNDISILPQNSRDLNVTPYSTYNLLLNNISYNSAGNKAVYEFDAPHSGFYKIGLNYSNDNANATAFRKISIDGKVPFGELLHYPFRYSGSFTLHTLSDNSGDFLFYLEKGRHIIDIEVDGAVIAAVTEPLKVVSRKLSDLYLDMRKLVGVNPDRNRDWEVYDYFPDIEQVLQSYIGVINESKEFLNNINGKAGQTQGMIFLDSAVRVLEKLLDKPDKIPNNFSLISEGSSSAVQCISSAVTCVGESVMSLDRIFITPAQSAHDYNKRGSFAGFFESVKAFFYSFGGHYTVKTDSDTLEIWVNRPLQNINLIQKLADAEFTAKTGIKVNITMLKDENKLVLANASGMTPDALLGVSSWIPYELGLRGLIYNLNDSAGLKETMGQFPPGSMLPLIVDGNVLGLPETYDPFVLYYRKDVFEKLNLGVPDTWDDLKKILPVLQRNGMNFYLPTSSSAANKPISVTAPFIYQYGGSLYNSDAAGTAINSEKAIDGIKLMTDLYTSYGLPQQVQSFSESFRNGSIPAGVATMSVYSQLLVSAPELAGLWDIALVPGVEDENGETVRWQSGGATACAVMKNSKAPEKSWEFIKWWLSAEVQTNYAQQCRAIWGNEFFWVSSNLSAFANSAYAPAHKNIITEQLGWWFEVPRIPGWYMVERELSNAWSYIVLDGYNVRYAIDNAVQASNKEIRRKLEEFGYIEGGKLVKEYKITTVEDVLNWTK